MAYNQNDAVRLKHVLEAVDKASDYTAEVAQAAAAAIAERELSSNKTTSLSASSTDTQYPSAKAVYNALQGAGGVKIVTVSLPLSWSGSGPFTQTVTVSGGTANSMVDLRPDAATVGKLIASGTKALYIVNNNGTFTAYAHGAAPAEALTVQAAVSEVSA